MAPSWPPSLTAPSAAAPEPGPAPVARPASGAGWPAPGPWWGRYLKAGRGRLGPHLRSAVILVAIAVAAATALWWQARAAAPPAPIEATLPTALATLDAAAPTEGLGPSPSATTVAKLVVHVTGAVREPGVVVLAAGSRVTDLVDAAGGLTADADPARLNLAAPLADGTQVWIPAIGEEPPEVVGPSAPAASTPSGQPGSEAPPGPVDINRASADELEALPGIGPSLAAAVVAYRDEHGPFASLDGLLDVPGIGPAKLDALRQAAVAGP